MLTTIDEYSASGISGVEWDAVELPSQFMENWCYHKPTLLSVTKHIETGEPLSDELFDKIMKSRTFLAGSYMVRQLCFARIDLALYSDYDPQGGKTPFELYQDVAKETLAIQPDPGDRFLCSFSHIFAGGYSAGYYSYKWAEVLSADAFGLFEDNGLENPKVVSETGRKFRSTVLALGGSEHPMDVFVKFRGRKPKVEPLLRTSGLL